MGYLGHARSTQYLLAWAHMNSKNSIEIKKPLLQWNMDVTKFQLQHHAEANLPQE
jgi:hypothetical protein